MPSATYSFKFKPSSTVMLNDTTYTVPAGFYALVNWSTNASGILSVNGSAVQYANLGSTGQFWLTTGDQITSTAAGWRAVVNLFPI